MAYPEYHDIEINEVILLVKSVLVTGGAGFIGSHLGCALLDAGHRVTVMDNLDDYYDITLKRRNLDTIGKHGDFDFVCGDIRDLALLKGSMDRNSVDAVFHEAARPGVLASVTDPLTTISINIKGTLNVLTAAVEMGAERVINASSSSVYGKVSYLPFDEDHPCEPVSPYGVSKLAGEHYCRIFGEIHGLSVTSLRYFTVYGPRMRPDLAISIFVRKALTGESIEIFGNGSKTRDFTFIDDIVKANLLFLDSDTSGIYNVGYGSSIDVKTLARKIIDITGSDSEIIRKGDRKGDAEHTLASVEHLASGFGWRPETGIDEGLERYIESVRRVMG